MKITTTLALLASTVTAPVLAVWLSADRSSSPEILWSIYSVAGLLFVAAIDYTPRRPLALPCKATGTTASWTRSVPAKASRFRRTLHTRKSRVLSNGS